MGITRIWGLCQFDRHVRCDALEFTQQLRKDSRICHRARVANLDVSHLAALGACGHERGALDLSEHSASFHEKLATHWRQADVARTALEKAYAQFFLEPLNVLRQCRLSEMEPLGCTPEMQRIGEHHEGAQAGPAFVCPTCIPRGELVGADRN